MRGKAPFSLTEYATPIQYHETVNYNMGLFAQDQWTIKRLTANYGVRIDFLKASVDPQDIAAGPFTPARHYDGDRHVPNWKDIDPRLGVAYDLFGNGKTALKASIGRYVVADAYTIARAVNPVTSTINPTTRTWSATPATQPVPRLQPPEPAGERLVRSDAHRRSAPRSRRRRSTIPRLSTDGASGRTTGRSSSASSSRWRRACRCTPATRAVGSATSSPRRTPR